MNNRWRFGVLATVVAATGCSHLAERRFVARFEDRPAPDFELKSLEGDTVKLSNLRGKPVVVAFFGYR